MYLFDYVSAEAAMFDSAVSFAVGVHASARRAATFRELCLGTCLLAGIACPAGFHAHGASGLSLAFVFDLAAGGLAIRAAQAARHPDAARWTLAPRLRESDPKSTKVSRTA